MTIFFHTKELALEDAEYIGTQLAKEQRAINWKIGDLARHARDVLKLGDNFSQVFPEWVSPGLIARCEAVSRAYPTEESRNILATWTQHMKVANRPNRIKLLAEMVDRGLTSDESNQIAKTESKRWLLAIDVNYFLHRFWYSGAGIEAAVSVSQWIQRTVERLREKGLTDVACCFDSRTNHRKELTADWEDKYKDRPEKDVELKRQLGLVHELLKGHGFTCVSVEGMEADDCMASYAIQFPGRVTIMTQDKDLRQCLSSKCNMLLDVEWIKDEESGDSFPDYKWLSAKQHTEATRIPPQQWVEYQTLMGDATDGVKGAAGIGEKGAADLVKQFGTVEAVIAAAKAGDESIREKKRESLIAFEGKMDITRQLVTMRTDLKLPTNTRI